MTTNNAPGLHLDSGEFVPAAELAAPRPVAPTDLITIRKPTTRAEVEWLAKLAHLLVSDVNSALDAVLTEQHTTARYGPLTHDKIREVFMAYGFTIKAGETDLKPYVYDAAAGLLRAASRAAAQVAANPPSIDDLCARIKAADDAAADNDYMLDSDDCIKVLRGEWNGPLAMDKPDPSTHSEPAQDAKREYPPLPETAATGLGEKYDAFDRNGRSMGEAYETILYFNSDQMRGYVDADRASRIAQKGGTNE